MESCPSGMDGVRSLAKSGLTGDAGAALYRLLANLLIRQAQFDHLLELQVADLRRWQHQFAAFARRLLIVFEQFAKRLLVLFFLVFFSLAIRALGLKVFFAHNRFDLKVTFVEELILSVIETGEGLFFERNFLVVLDISSFSAEAAADLDAGGLELAPLLQSGEASGLLELALAGLALRLLALGVGEAGARLRQHLELVLVH
ncbi:hypothetical protein BpHYR1_047312, partial [Brachionus plicatilis]